MTDTGTVKTVCMDADEIERSLTRIAHQILEANKGADNIALVGIVTRGDLLAKRLAEKIEQIEGVEIVKGRFVNDADIREYRKSLVIDQAMQSLLFKGADPLGARIKLDSTVFTVGGV